MNILLDGGSIFIVVFFYYTLVITTAIKISLLTPSFPFLTNHDNFNSFTELASDYTLLWLTVFFKPSVKSIRRRDVGTRFSRRHGNVACSIYHNQLYVVSYTKN